MELDSRFIDNYMAAMEEERHTLDRDLWVEMQLTRTFMANSRVSMFSAVAALPVPLMLLYPHLNAWVLGLWLAVALIISAFRYRVVHTYFASARQSDPASVQAFVHRYRWSWPASALVWSSLMFFYLGRVPPDNQYMSLLVIIGMGAFSTGLMSARPDHFRLYVHALSDTCALAILFTWASMQQLSLSSPLLVLLVLCLLFWRLVIYTGGRFYLMQRRSYELQFDNEKLIHSLRGQTASAIDAARVKDRLLASAAHDLRQPVHALAFYADWLRNEPEMSATVMPKILAATDSVNLLFNSLFDFARIEAGTIEPQPVSLSVRELVDELVVQHTPEAQTKNLVLRSRVQPAHILSDPVLLRRILSNLISNAIRYTNSGGVLVSTRLRRGMLWIEVWDTGQGIAAEHVSSVFREFYKASSHEGTEEGFGLGLAIVKRLCEALGHRIELNTRPGRGTRFRLMVFIADQNAELTDKPGATSREALTQSLGQKA